MAVWHDRHEGSPPSRRTATVGRDNRGMAVHDMTMFGGIQSTQHIPSRRDCRNRHGSTELPHSRDLQDGIVCLDAGSPGETGSRARGLSRLHRANISAVFEKKRRSGGQQAALAGARMAKSPIIAHSKAGLGGICRENSR